MWPLLEALSIRQESETTRRMRPSALYKNKMFFGTDDAFSRSVEIVVTPAIFAAIGWVFDRWLGTSPWIAVSFGALAFLGKIAAEWYRYVGRMSGIEEEMTADRPTNQRGLDRVQEIDDRLPAGVTLEERSDT